MARPKIDVPLPATERQRRYRARKHQGLVGSRELTVEQKLTKANREIRYLKRWLRQHEEADARRAQEAFPVMARWGMERNRLQHEIERLRHLLAAHGIEP